MRDRVDLSVIIPMYNEEENVVEAVRHVVQALAPFPGEWEIVLVNDGSSDGTLAVARHVAATDKRVRVTSYAHNRGRGKALRTGFATARGEYIVSIDADLSYDPKYILDLVRVLEEEEDVDIVVGSPYMPGGGTEAVPRGRLWVSRVGNWILSLAMGGNIKTITCIFRAYRRRVLESLDLESDGKEIHLEILSKALASGYRVKEVPAILRSRRRGKSKFRFRATAFSHIVFTFFERPLLLFGMVGILLITLGLIGGVYIIYLWQQKALNPERPLMTLLVLLILTGVQILSFGFIGTQLVGLRKEIYKLEAAERRQGKVLANIVAGNSSSVITPEDPIENKAEQGG